MVNLRAKYKNLKVGQVVLIQPANGYGRPREYGTGSDKVRITHIYGSGDDFEAECCQDGRTWSYQFDEIIGTAETLLSKRTKGTFIGERRVQF